MGRDPTLAAIVAKKHLLAGRLKFIQQIVNQRRHPQPAWTRRLPHAARRVACARAVLRAGRRLRWAYEEIKRHVRDTEYWTPR